MKRRREDLELLIHLRRLRSIVAEYTADYLEDVDITTRVLNLDCEGMYAYVHVLYE